MNVSSTVASKTTNGTYDDLGVYNQDKINGFTDDIFNHLFRAMQLQPGLKILDHMCGNGNLIQRMVTLFPELTTSLKIYGIDIAKKQLQIGRKNIRRTNVQFLHGDVTDMSFISGFFHRIVRKSGAHEIPKKNQIDVLEEIYRTLKDRGLFIDVSMAFEEEDVRDEFRELTRKKDELAGLTSLANNRYFLTKAELYEFMDRAGFSFIYDALSFNYTISINTATSYYFKKDPSKAEELVAYAKECSLLKEKGVLKRTGKDILLKPPAKIVIARK